MHVSNVSASFRQGITIDSSIDADEPDSGVRVSRDVSAVTIAMSLLRWK
jgi:hypothetical protein